MASSAFVVLTLLVAGAAVEKEASFNHLQANPIRKVVTMLQNMQKKVEAEGEKEAKLYEKFMCYCKTSGGDLSGAISSAETKMPEVASDIEESEAKLAQLKEDLKQHQVDRAAAKAAMSQASSIREKEAAEFAKVSAEYEANIDVVSKAVAAVEKGMSGGFLQTDAAQVLRRVVASQQSMLAADREDILAFLGQKASDEYAYAPSSGEITGILKTLGEQMSKSLSEATDAEKAAIADYDGLISAKTKEVQSLTKSIEEKTMRVGDLAVKIVEMKADLSDTEASLIEDKKFLQNLEKTCAVKTKEWEEIVKTRSEELVALAETIKILNDDDALELFKKTLPSGASLVQVQVSASTQSARALAALQGAAKRSPGIDFITMAIKGKKIGFEKVITMIDDMVATLKKEQTDDSNKAEYCKEQFDVTSDKKKTLERSIGDLETQVADTKEGIKSVEGEVKALEAGIKALDKAVSEATSQRKEEHEDYVALMASDSAAKELLKFAVNRLNKFYNPKLYKAPPKRVLSEEDQITVNMGGTLAPTAAPGGIAGTGVTVLADVSLHGAPPPPPEAPGAYAKKTEESGGVIAMVNLLIKDLDKEMTEAETSEKDAQADYEAMMSESAEKRAADTKSLTEKGAAKAEMQTDLETYTEEKAAAGKELMATASYMSSLHAECDWLLQYYDVRKEARDSEIGSLTNAKAVLSGADFSLVQTHARKFLKRA